MALTISMKLNLPLADIIKHDDRLIKHTNSVVRDYHEFKDTYSKLDDHRYLNEWNFTTDYKNRLVVEGYCFNGKGWVTSPVRELMFITNNILRIKTLSGTVYKLSQCVVKDGCSSFDFSKREKNGWSVDKFYEEAELSSWSVEVTERGSYYLVGYLKSLPSHVQFATTPIVSMIVDKNYGLSFLTKSQTLYRVSNDDVRFHDEHVLF